MAELNELNELDKKLRQLIEERNKPIGPNDYEELEKKWLQESKQRVDKLKNWGIVGMFMGAVEHGQPYKEMTNMAIVEHGQPYKYDNYRTLEDEMKLKEIEKLHKDHMEYINKKYNPALTLMCIRQHGQPYKSNIKDNINVSATYMCIGEHGKPYKNMLGFYENDKIDKID